MTASRMKKFIFAFLILLPVVFFTVCEEAPVVDTYQPPVIDVVYSNDWRYVTIFFDDTDTSPPIAISTSVNRPPPPSRNADGSSPALAERAMTRDTAQFAFDYFEVVFCYTETNGNKRVARATWEIGKRAGIIGVYRTQSGIDYSAAAAEEGKGAALLFAGRKNGKTLLGMGRISSVDEVPGAVITDQSFSVTFELSAITGAVNADPSKSSFTTAYWGSAASAENTYVVKAVIYPLIRQDSFPLFILPGGKPGVAAQYQFGVDPYNNRDWSYYSGGIIVAGPLEEEYPAITREVRFPAGNGRYYYPNYLIDQTTKVKMTNNQTAGAAVENPLKFSFNTENTNNAVKTENGIFTLVFCVPVYAVTGHAAGLNVPGRWYLEPAYQSYRYNIDNGIDSTGGGVLIGVDAPPNFEATTVRR